MTPVVRWKFHDPRGRRPDYTVPINPNSMSSPLPSKSVEVVGQRALQAPPAPTSWTFGGIIYTEEHYVALQEWVELGGRIQLSDHLGRTFSVQLLAFEPVPTRSRKPWRYQYEIRAQVYGGPT